MKKISKDRIKKEFLQKYKEKFNKPIEDGSSEQKYEILVTLVNSYVEQLKIDTNKKYNKSKEKQIYYFSMEFLVETSLKDLLLNMGIYDSCKEALTEINIDINEIVSLEKDNGICNNELREAAFGFLDSMASFDIAGHGCGIRYKYGFFKQKIIDGNQVEISNDRLGHENLLEKRNDEKSEIVKFGGRVEVTEFNGHLMFRQLDYEPVLAIPYDISIIGYGNNTVNNLRLWSAEPINNEIDFSYFTRGDYLAAIEYKNSVESISRFLYPEESFDKCKKLYLKQEYFFVSAGIQSIVHHYKKHIGDIRTFHEKVAIHINGTNGSLVIPELMRIFLDEEKLSWNQAWRITINTISYTSDKVLSDTFEKWPVEMFKDLLPRIFMIIHEINERFCKKLWKAYEGQWDKISRMSIISHNYIKLSNLAIVGSHSINGVTKFYSQILKNESMRDFYYYYPNKFNSKINGINHRKWLLKCNKGLSDLIKETIGDSFIKNPRELLNFEKFSYDKNVQERLYHIKKINKEKLAHKIWQNNGIKVDVDSMFDIQIKSICASKRQILNILRIINLYNRILENRNINIVPRTFIFAGKVSPGYYFGKNIVKFIDAVSNVINNDKRVNDKIKVIFMENYNVSLAECIIPASDLSEQISITIKEKLETSNIKFMMNGSILMAALDGINIEIRDEISDDNIFIFGMKTRDILNCIQFGGYSSMDIYNSNLTIKSMLSDLLNGTYGRSKDDFRMIYDNLIAYNDDFFILKDFESYIDAQRRADNIYKHKYKWQKMCAVNIAHSGAFSSDCSIKEYVTGIWGAELLYKNI